MNDELIYKERMLIEFEQLIERMTSAKNYVTGEKSEDNELLCRQIAVMEEYKTILAQRILREMGRY